MAIAVVRQLRPRIGQRTRAALITALAAFLVFKAANRDAGLGDQRLAGLTVAIVGLLAIGRYPRQVFLFLLVLWASVLGIRPRPIHLGGIQTDLGELLVFALIGVWGVQVLAGRIPLRRYFLVPTAALLLAITTGALETFARGGTLHSMLGDIKTLLAYALVLPVVGWFSTQHHRAQLIRWLHTICVVGSVLTLADLLLHLKLPFVSTLPETVSALNVQLSGVTRIRPALTSMLVLLTLLVVARIATQGWTRGRAALLALYLVMQALTFTRSTWVPLMGCLVLLALFRRGEKQSLRGLRGTIAASVILTLALSLAASGLAGKSGRAFVLRLATVANPAVVHETSYQDRVGENRTAIRVLIQHPITGTGLTQPFGQKVYVYVDNPPRYVVQERLTVHNQYLFVWLQLGLAGLIWLGCTGVAIGRATRRWFRYPDPVLATDGLAIGLSLLCLALQALFETIIYYPAQILTTVCAIALLAPLRQGLDEQA